MNPILKTVDLTKNYGKFTALKNVNLTCLPGEVYGFIGPNGAGKTTAIRVLCGILKATSGEASILGMDAWKDATTIHKRLGFVPGDVALWPNLTGGEVIDFLLRLRQGQGENRRDEMIERFELDPTKKCRTYSKGNRQKVALIAAFAIPADIYILDEPTSGLDPLMERIFQELILEAKQMGAAVFLSSHILQEVERLCDKVSIIRGGEIIEMGEISKLAHLREVETLEELFMSYYEKK